MNPLIQMTNISKRYGSVQALAGVNLTLYDNQSLGLVGDNAAGKSTLMKILSGVIRADEGEILIEGKPVHFKSPREARKHGIEMVFQDFALCRNLWVAGNIFMGRELVHNPIGQIFGILDKRRMMDRSNSILENQKVDIGSCRKRAGALSGGQQQSVAIARALGFNAKVVIMDEPTASLGVQQAGRLIELTKSLTSNGVSLIYISHRMQDIFSICDRIMVLKTGENVGDFLKGEVTIDDIVRIMITGERKH